MTVAKKLDRMLTTARKRLTQILNRVLLTILRSRDRLVISVGRLVEFIGYHLAMGRLRALREMREARALSALPPKPAGQLTLDDEILAQEKAEVTPEQQEWIDNEERFNAVVMTGAEEKEWFEERARRVAMLKRLHLKGKLEQIGMDYDQIAAECGIPTDVAKALRENFDAVVK